MNWEQIISKLFLQIDDSSQLSDVEALQLINDIYADVCDDRAWSWLQSTYTGTTSTSVPYVALPAGFNCLIPNVSNSIWYGYGNLWVPRWGVVSGYLQAMYVPSASVACVFVGTTYSPYRIIDFSERRNYRDADGFAYIDIPNSRLVFTKQPTTAQAIEFDYKKVPDDITLVTSPLFRSGFHSVLVYGAAAQFDNLQLTDKTQSYQKENMFLYEKQLESMRIDDARIKLSLS